MNDLGIYVVIWIACGIASLLIAQSRKNANPVGWFLAGALFGPLGVIWAVVNAKEG